MQTAPSTNRGPNGAAISLPHDTTLQPSNITMFSNMSDVQTVSAGRDGECSKCGAGVVESSDSWSELFLDIALAYLGLLVGSPGGTVFIYETQRCAACWLVHLQVCTGMKLLY